MDRTVREFENRGRLDFTSTHWSVVLAASACEGDSAAAALEALCGTYWYPLYAFVRRRGHKPEDAEDLTQQFFAHLIEGNRLRHVHPSKGRFRQFLLAAMKNFLANEWAKAHALKRGGACSFHSLDALAAEKRYAREPADLATPDALYDRSWALTLLENCLVRLRKEYSQAGKVVLFEAIKEYLTPGACTVTYVETALRLGSTEKAVAMNVHRLKCRYRECLREQIAETVNSPDDVEGEIRDLWAILGCCG